MIFIFKFICNYLIIVFHTCMRKMYIIYVVVIGNMDLLFICHYGDDDDDDEDCDYYPAFTLR